MGTSITYTAVEHLMNKVRYGVPKKAVLAIAAERGLDASAAFMDTDKDTLRLCYADLLKWVLTGPSKVNNSVDTDNGWSHTEGGYELGDEDRKLLRDEANAIYGELEPESAIVSQSVFRMTTLGVCRARKDLRGNWLPPEVR